MVNNTALRLKQPDECTIVMVKGRRKITNGPVYYLPAAQGIAKTIGIQFVTEKAVSDKWDYDMGEDSIVPFINALWEDLHRNSERCTTSQSLTPPPWETDCDAYTMKWNNFAKKQWNDGKEYYIKFGFSDFSEKCLIVSIHPSENEDFI